MLVIDKICSFLWPTRAVLHQSDILSSQISYYIIVVHLVGSTNGTTTTYYLTDAEGSLLTSLSASAITGEQLSAPYGPTRYAVGSLGTAKAFTGQEADPLTACPIIMRGGMIRSQGCSSRWIRRRAMRRGSIRMRMCGRTRRRGLTRRGSVRLGVNLGPRGAVRQGCLLRHHSVVVGTNSKERSSNLHNAARYAQSCRFGF
jgi:hypothetical protein